MALERRHLNEAGEKQMGYCQAVRSGHLVFISGVVSWDENFEPTHVGDMAGQIGHIYSTLERVLQQFGLSFENVVKETGFTTDMDAALAALGARAKYFPDGKLPASSWVEVSRLVHPDLLLEVELIASTE